MAHFPHEPDLPSTQRTNVYEEDTFKLRVLFGTASITSYIGKDIDITRNSTGNYTFQVSTAYDEITGFTGQFLDAGGQILLFVIVSQTIDTNGQVIIESRTAAGVTTDPTTGSRGYFSLSATKNSLNSKFLVTV